SSDLLERTDTEEERRLRGCGEDDRSPGTSSIAESDRRDRQHRQTHGLAGYRIEDVLSEPDEVGVGQVEPASVESVVPDSYRHGCDDGHSDEREGQCPDRGCLCQQPLCSSRPGTTI